MLKIYENKKKPKKILKPFKLFNQLTNNFMFFFKLKFIKNFTHDLL